MHKLTKVQTVQSLLSRTVPNGECLEWTGSLRSGYGRVTTQGKGWTVIRLIWELRNGPIDKGLVVRHKCDNRKCCKPEHLELGTRADNMNDRFIRGGYSMYPSIESVVSLRRIGLTQGSIAAFFGVTQGHISRICSGEYRGAKC
ncbi:hypothetical protein RCIP0109_00026 [Klebsiella phage RCIP0109]